MIYFILLPYFTLKTTTLYVVSKITMSDRFKIAQEIPAKNSYSYLLNATFKLL